MRKTIKLNFPEQLKASDGNKPSAHGAELFLSKISTVAGESGDMGMHNNKSNSILAERVLVKARRQLKKNNTTKTKKNKMQEFSIVFSASTTTTIKDYRFVAAAVVALLMSPLLPP